MKWQIWYTCNCIVTVFPHWLTAGTKRKKPKAGAKSTTKKKSSRKRLVETNKDPWSEDPWKSGDDFETDALSSARKALTQSVRKSTRKKILYSSEEEDEGDLHSAVKLSVRKGTRLLLSDEDD